ncbi:MAG: hypothetical protein LUH05_04180 [Candidatus Gastranaerophilales bacterium]|nr:hypothetical protein [Candidatus Gastranaerophilales bacterium]
MGINYYLKTDFCPCCGKPKTTIHLGKASCGHRFLFEYQNGLKSIKDLKKLLKKGIIKNEYEKQISETEFLIMVEEKQQQPPIEEDRPGFLTIDGYEFLEADAYEFS